MISLPGHLQVVKGGSCFSLREIRGTRRRFSLFHLRAVGSTCSQKHGSGVHAKKRLLVTKKASEPKSFFKTLHTPLHAQLRKPPLGGRWERGHHGGEQRKECSVAAPGMFASCQLNFLLPGNPVLSSAELLTRPSPCSWHPRGSGEATMGTPRAI